MTESEQQQLTDKPTNVLAASDKVHDVYFEKAIDPNFAVGQLMLDDRIEDLFLWHVSPIKKNARCWRFLLARCRGGIVGRDDACTPA